MRTLQTTALLLVSLVLAIAVTAASAAPTVTPILFAFGQGNPSALVVGAWSGPKWLDWEKAPKHLKSGDRYRLFARDGSSRIHAIGKPELSPASGSAYNVRIGGALAKSGPQVGLPQSAGWKVAPRPTAMLKPDSGFTRSIAELLRRKGLADPQVEIAQARRCDLDGDGSAETIFEAHSPGMDKQMQEGGPAVAGQFSIVALRQSNRTMNLVGGEIRTKGGDDTGPPQLFELTHLLDLNGDGRMEIVASTRYYEGGGANIYTWDGKRVQQVLTVSDGA